MRRILFITGTDTGVGKTILTGLLLAHLRRQGERVLAVKPFCTGGTEDSDLLQALQASVGSPVTPFYFREPVAPLVAARLQKKRIRRRVVLDALARARAGCDTLLVEGSGGLLTPLGEGFSLLDLIVKMRGEALVVAPNKLGTLNHSRLTVAALRSSGVRRLQIVLMTQRRGDASASSNPSVLRELLRPMPVVEVPYLGARAGRVAAIRQNAKKLKKVLARIMRPDSFCPRRLTCGLE